MSRYGQNMIIINAKSDVEHYSLAHSIITFAKRVMFLAMLVCVSVCTSVRP